MRYKKKEAKREEDTQQIQLQRRKRAVRASRRRYAHINRKKERAGTENRAKSRSLGGEENKGYTPKHVKRAKGNDSEFAKRDKWGIL